MQSKIHRKWICFDTDTCRFNSKNRVKITLFKWISCPLLVGIFFACSANFAFGATIPPLNLIVSKDLIFLTPLQGKDRLVIIDSVQKKASAIPVPAVKKWSGTMAVSNDGDRLYLVGDSGMIYEINPNQRKMTNSFDPLALFEKSETDIDISGYLRKSGLDWKKFPLSSIFKFPSRPLSNIHSIALGANGDTLYVALGVKAEGPSIYLNDIPLLLVMDLPSKKIKHAVLWGQEATSVKTFPEKSHVYFDQKADRIFLSPKGFPIYLFNKDRGSFQAVTIDQQVHIKSLIVSKIPMLSAGRTSYAGDAIQHSNKIYLPIQKQEKQNNEAGIAVVDMSDSTLAKFYLGISSIGSNGVVSPGGKHLYLIFEDLWAIDLQKRALVHQQPLNGIYAVSATMSTNGRELYLLSPHGTIQALDTRTYKVLWQIKLP